MDFIKEDYIWIDQPTGGQALLLKGGKNDSLGDQIKGDIFYQVGKHKVSGKAIIIPIPQIEEKDKN